MRSLPKDCFVATVHFVAGRGRRNEAGSLWANRPNRQPRASCRCSLRKAPSSFPLSGVRQPGQLDQTPETVNHTETANPVALSSWGPYLGATGNSSPSRLWLPSGKEAHVCIRPQLVLPAAENARAWPCLTAGAPSGETGGAGSEDTVRSVKASSLIPTSVSTPPLVHRRCGSS